MRSDQGAVAVGQADRILDQRRVQLDGNARAVFAPATTAPDQYRMGLSLLCDLGNGAGPDLGIVLRQLGLVCHQNLVGEERGVLGDRSDAAAQNEQGDRPLTAYPASRSRHFLRALAYFALGVFDYQQNHPITPASWRKRSTSRAAAALASLPSMIFLRRSFTCTSTPTILSFGAYSVVA